MSKHGVPHSVPRPIEVRLTELIIAGASPYHVAKAMWKEGWFDKTAWIGIAQKRRQDEREAESRGEE